jgi:hypothetical protein
VVVGLVAGVVSGLEELSAGLVSELDAGLVWEDSGLEEVSGLL